MTTLRTIAQKLNLSVMAVSKALRDAPDMSAATKARVQAEAKSLNYRPNAAARFLRTRRSGLLGLVVPDLGGARTGPLTSALEQHATTAGYQLIVSQSQNRADREQEQIERLIQRQVEGVLLIPAVRWERRLATLEQFVTADLPAVLLENYPAGAERFSRCGRVMHNEARAAELAVEHLIGLGHRHILFLAGPTGSSAAATRFETWRKTMAAAKLDLDDGQIFLAGTTEDDGRRALLQAIGEETRFTAVVAFNDKVGLGALSVLRQQGWRVPEEVSIVGFGDTPAAAHAAPALTTLRTDPEQMARRALALLETLIKREPVSPCEIPVELITRGSTAPPSGKADTVPART